MAEAEMGGLATSAAVVMSPQSTWKRLEAKWNSVQVENQGTYSIERLESLVMYYQTASRKRVDGLITGSFGYGLSIVMMVAGVVFNSLMARLIPGLEFTTYRKILVSVGTTTAFESTCLLASSQIGFPVPFMMQFGVFLLGVYSTLMIWLVLGSSLFVKGSLLKTSADRYYQFFGSFTMLGGVFPIYKVLYELIPVKYRDIAVIILPIWKFSAKRFIVSNTRKLEDVMPLVVALSVDFFCSLFIAVCMSTSRSISFTLLFITVNIVQSLIEIRAMSANGEVLLRLLDERKSSQSQIRTKSDFSDISNLLTIILDATQTCASLPPKSLEQVRLWACLPYSITTDKLERLLPIAFMAFKSILECLPNVVYYPGGAGTWNMDSVLNVSLVAVLEIGLLLSCSIFLRYKYGVSPLYQLAFVLETEVWLVQTGFYCFLIAVFQYELQHFG
ncbi:unnamed protein product [Phytophthora fragariaefolia]|uniref:Unnamed protein product n=1 Tax=Phytophthora fragariaefolia TaxID=1490495 RepID=A0A9W7D3H8_9STRA|nr:unnamed protein product [Phytophthora fragariaefolia]